MTDKPDEAVDVTDADRLAAWKQRPEPYQSEKDYSKWMSGVYDSYGMIQSYAAHRHASQQSMQSRLDAAREALKLAERQFQFYADNHSAKGTVDGDTKALTNSRYAGMMTEALADIDQPEGERS